MFVHHRLHMLEKHPKAPQKALQNSGAEGMVQNQYLWEVFAP
jgi:hypothetical protein